MALTQYGWLIAIISIAFIFSAFGNGANDVANSYATSVAARTLTMPQVGVLSMVTEFVGAVALGKRVTDTIKNDIIDIGRFDGNPGALILAMTCAEIGSATWLMLATALGFPVSTTQTIVGALVGVGFGSQADIAWSWDEGGVSQVAASWGIAPAVAACFSALLFATLKFGVLERGDSFKWGMRLIPLYLAFTGAVLALFIVIEAPGMDSLEELGAGKSVGIILGVFFGCLLLAYVFFLPYFHRRLVKNDSRVRAWHILLGPLLWSNDPWLPFPSKSDEVVIDYYQNSYTEENPDTIVPADTNGLTPEKSSYSDAAFAEKGREETETTVVRKVIVPPEPEIRFLEPTKHLPIYNPRRIVSVIKYLLLQGVTRDCVTHNSEKLRNTHAVAIQYDNKVEHLWTYAQIASAIMMSIAHGSNDVANAVGPWVAAYNTFKAGEVATENDTPVWILVIAGFLLGAGFWFFGFKIVRALGNRITRMSPPRGYSAELGAAITVLLASRLGLPVSTTQCLTGATLGVALMNFNLKAVNWRQVLFIMFGWVLTLPASGLIAGLLVAMALNSPSIP